MQIVLEAAYFDSDILPMVVVMLMAQVQELAVAASRFAECQKTIASLSQKLESLAAFEDFLVDPDKNTF